MSYITSRMTMFRCVPRRYRVCLGILLMVTLVGIYRGFVAHLSYDLYHRRETKLESNIQNTALLPPGEERTQTAMIDCHNRKVLTRECQALRGLGYTVINYNQHVDTVDLLWTLDSRRTPRGINVEANVMNHIQATRALYHKNRLLTAGNISVILPAFILPGQQQQFHTHVQERMKRNPGALWIKKSFSHRGVSIINTSDILSIKKKSFLVQEYLADPLLISNRKFDLGVFSLVTSVSPLRFYLYTGNYLTKFCTADYLPFDPNIREKYVEDEELVKVWGIPALKEYVGKNPGERKDIDILYNYLDNQGYNSSKLHNDIIGAASEVGCKREKDIAAYVDKRGKNSLSQKSFEFLRFDFSIQRDLSVWVIEINHTPVTYTNDAHEGMYVKILTSTMVMAGLVNVSWTKQKMAENTDVTTVIDADIDVDHKGCEECLPEMCNTTWTCSVCSLCLMEMDRIHFRTAVLEHRRQKDWVRVVPAPFKNQEAARKWKPTSDPLYQTLSRSTQIMALWYHRKCLTDAAWCS